MQRLKDTFRRKLSSGDPLGRNHDSGEKKYSSKDKYNNCQLTIPTTARQVRSSSCDEIVFKQVAASLASIGTGGIGIMDTVLMDELSHQQHTFSGSTLELPTPVGRSTRSKSFDCTTGKTKKGRNSQGSIGFLEIPKWRMLIRRSSSQSAERGGSLGSIFGDKCIHCALIEEAFNLQLLISSNRSSVSSVGSPDLETRGSLSDDNRQTDELSKKPDCNDEEDEVIGDDDVICDGDDNEKRSGERNTRHSRGDLLIATAAAHSVDYPFETRRGNGITSTETKLGKSSSLNDECLISPEEGLPLVTLSAAPELELLEPTSPESLEDLGNGITVISLEVPVIKQNRSASIDASFLKVPERYEIIPETELPPCKTHRSNSVDITLPTKPGDFYMVLRSMKATPIFEKKAIQGEIKISTENGETRTLRSAPDWGETAINGDHLWVSTSASGDLCYVGENECSKQGPRLCCPACKITAHTGCIGILIDKIKFHCKPTFKDVGVRQYREQTVIHHHWAHRRHQKGRCRQCGKSFQSKLSFGNKEIVALSCSWCKTNYHNKESCFSMERLTETCNMGIHADLIVPPSWIVKLPRKGSFKSSIRRSPKNKRSSSKRRTKKDDSSGSTSEYSQHLPVHPILPIHSGSSSPPPDAKIPVTIPGGQHRSFAIKPIPSSTSKPLLVFINPKSGGNQGSKLMQKFQWLLNPRQVFDLTQGGPKPGLELYKKVPNLRILACGGDGTAGWILSTLDDLGLNPNPPLAVLPLGTGNDLARALGWGGGYTDEPMSKILLNIKDGEVVQLDRWTLKVTRNTDAALNDLANDPSENGKETLPLNVVNNYFSIGVDAHIALEFHEAREAHPERFNSRLRNKMFYGQAGGKDLLQRKWKDLCGFITLECDGVDLTQRLRDLRIHSLLFLNIPSYGGGTRPWGTNSPSYENPRTDDGLIEVIGLTTYQLPLLQAGGHGSCIAQCRSARIITSRTIPMQVDGEPCRLLPSVIELELHNQANMIAKAKSHSQIAQIPLEREFTLEIRKLNLTDYETYHYDKERLKDASVLLGMLTISPDLELDRVRVQINKLVHGIDNREAESRDDNEGRGYRLRSKFSLSSDWCFVDACTAERFFRVDKAQEHLHYVVDICNEDTNRMLYILDPADESKIEDCSATSIPNLLADPDLNASLEFTNIEERNNNNTIVLLKGSMDGSMDKGEDGASDSNWKGGSASASSLEPRHVYLDKDLGKERCQGNDNSNDGNRQNKKVDNVLSATPPKSVKVEKVSTEIINAARQGNFERVKTLLHEGYSSLAVDENGMTALHHAADHGYEDIVQLLVQEEPHLIDIPDCEEGQTALHKAARNRRQKVCCILAAAGCSLSKLDNSGLTARQIAEQVQDQELAAYLQHFENYQNTLRDKETTV